jgi:hypothetical protein
LQLQPAIEFVGMMGYGPTSFHDLFCDDDLLIEGSSVILSPLRYLALRECAMADVQGQQPVPVETEDMHTLPDPRTQALANAQVHGEDLRQQRQHEQPPALVHTWCNSKPNARNIVGSGRHTPVKSSKPSS